MSSHSQSSQSQQSINNIGSSTGSGSEPLTFEANDDEGPLWKYVNKVEKKQGGTWIFQCKFCSETRSESYKRVRAHLIHEKNAGIAICKKLTFAEAKEFKRIDDEFWVNKRSKGPKCVPLPSEYDKMDGDSLAKKRKVSQSPIWKSFGIEAREQLDQIIARMFYTGGLPFNLARNPSFIESYTFAANHNIPSYTPPGYNKLRTTLLALERANVEKQLAPIKGTWKQRGVTICTDGWSDPLRKPLINFMATSGSGPMFLRAVNCFGETKDKYFIANLMKEVIEEVGHENVVQIVTDNAANCKAAGEIIESEFPHIFWTPCVVHTLNLALKNICAAKDVDGNEITYDECHWITEIHGDAIQIKNYIMNHTMRLAMFLRFSPLKLLSIADTRFASIIVMLKRFKLIKQALQALVISDAWNSYRDEDMTKANFVKERVLNDDWWDKLTYILDFTRPIYDMIRLCDTDKPCLHIVYEMWDDMIEKVKGEIYKKEDRPLLEFSPFYDVVYDILVARWTKNSTPLHCVAHSLNPRYYSHEWLGEVENRVAPHCDGELSMERLRFFRRFFHIDNQAKVMCEYAQFSMKDGPFGDPCAIATMYSMDPKNWWANFGAQTPLLQSLAFRVLGQPTSSSCCERNWSTYAFIHSLRRNKLTPSRAQDLVYIHNNLRLLSRNVEEEKSKMWDVGGDEFDSMEDVGYLEFANLSLDEPALENVLIGSEE